MVDRREVRDFADLARLGYVTRARITQIMNMLNLAPDIQEEILGVDGITIRSASIVERQAHRRPGRQPSRNLFPRLSALAGACNRDSLRRAQSRARRVHLPAENPGGAQVVHLQNCSSRNLIIDLRFASDHRR
jgi:hypothetical protein